MDKILLTAPCGIDCFNCPLLVTNITDDVRSNTAKYLNMPPEDVECKGCRPEKGQCKGNPNCATWVCVQAKGHTFCHECNDFPCEKLSPSFKGAQFPHNLKVYNNCRIKLVGLDAWIKEADDIRKRYFNGNFIPGKGPVIK